MSSLVVETLTAVGGGGALEGSAFNPPRCLPSVPSLPNTPQPWYNRYLDSMLANILIYTHHDNVDSGLLIVTKRHDIAGKKSVVRVGVRCEDLVRIYPLVSRWVL